MSASLETRTAKDLGDKEKQIHIIWYIKTVVFSLLTYELYGVERHSVLFDHS